jgi:hypothetical protein
MVDFDAYISEKGDIYEASSSDSESDGERESSRRRPRRKPPPRLEKESVGQGWACKCDDCNGKEASQSTTFYNYDSVDPKGDPPEPRDHYFFLCDRNALAFALHDREFG